MNGDAQDAALKLSVHEHNGDKVHSGRALQTSQPLTTVS